MSPQGEDPAPAPTRPLSQVSRWLRGVQAVCLVGAGLNHAHDIRQGGWLPYDYASLPVNVFWTTLVAWDPLTAGLLLWRPRVGVIMVLLLMVADVAVNSAVKYGAESVDWHGDVALQLQTLFLGFVAGTAPLIWLSAGRAACAGPSGATSEAAKSEAGAAAGRPGT